MGLSPRTWGNLFDDGVDGQREGSIPTHVGKPGPLGAQQPDHRVYPHARGETTLTL